MAQVIKALERLIFLSPFSWFNHALDDCHLFFNLTAIIYHTFSMNSETSVSSVLRIRFRSYAEEGMASDRYPMDIRACIRRG